MAIEFKKVSDNYGIYENGECYGLILGAKKITFLGWSIKELEQIIEKMKDLQEARK